MMMKTTTKIVEAAIHLGVSAENANISMFNTMILITARNGIEVQVKDEWLDVQSLSSPKAETGHAVFTRLRPVPD
jgi:hypothetical protein